MTNNDNFNLTERQKKILASVIEEYAETAAPVGSVVLAKLHDVSPATIRAEMAYLENAGLLSQPHTSAGRIPTDAGYRYYVNSLVEKFESAPDEAPKVPPRASRALAIRISSQSQADSAIRGAVNYLVELTGDLGLATIGSQLYVAGIARLFSQPEFVKPDRVQSIANLLDNLEPWLQEAQPGDAMNIFIGHENPIGKSSDASLIISKFRSPFSDSSYIGVLGPTRQDYRKVMSLVRHAGRLLEESL